MVMLSFFDVLGRFIVNLLSLRPHFELRMLVLVLQLTPKLDYACLFINGFLFLKRVHLNDNYFSLGFSSRALHQHLLH